MSRILGTMQIVIGFCLVFGFSSHAWGDDSTAWNDPTGGELSYTGNVGIGTTAPGSKLTISDNRPYVQFVETDSDNKKWHIGMYNRNLVFSDDGGYRKVTIRQNGNVGIGTAAPGLKLTISDNKPYVQFVETDSDNKKWHIGMYNRNLVFSDDGGYRKVTIRQNGNVGIGTASLAGHAKLSVKASSSQAYGVYGGADGYGLFGLGGTGGVYGGSENGKGVYGYSRNYRGVYGKTESGWAGYFDGPLYAQSASASIKSFKIDHPLDPENKYLYHSGVESPDMMNVYNGNVALTAKGEAWVELPEWFETLNKDFRYQLTAIGSPGPNLHIAKEISGNRFKIAGGEPGMKVSWQVTGIRQDPYAEKNRISVEEMKSADERGKYLHPKAYGLPENVGIGYDETRRMKEEYKRMEEENKRMEKEHRGMEQGH